MKVRVAAPRLRLPVMVAGRVLAAMSVLGIAVRDDDWIAIDTDTEWTATADSLVSLGKNTPVLGRTLRGRVVYAVVGGEARYEGGLRGATPVGSR